MRKRVSLFKYNLKMKRELGAYDPMREQEMMETTPRSLNLFDFRTGKVGDFHLIDEFSDASEYGGESETSISLIEDPDNPGQQTRNYLNYVILIVQLTGKLIRERNNLLPIDYLFFGFKSLSLF
jgi:hypothetical protein